MSASLSHLLPELRRLCRACGVEALWAFGSFARGEAGPDSDADFLVSFLASDPEAYTEAYFRLRESLEALLDRRVDLLEDKALGHGTLRRTIEREGTLCYAHENRDVA